MQELQNYKKKLELEAHQLKLPFFRLWVNDYFVYLNENKLDHSSDVMVKYYNNRFGGK